MADAGQTSTGRGPRLVRRIGSALLAVAIAFLGAKFPPVNRQVCHTQLVGGHDTLNWLCDAENLPVGTTRAADFIDAFLGKFFGSHRAGSAWAYLAGDESPEPVDPGFSQEWDPAVFVRRVSDVRPDDGFNVYVATVERYRYPDEWMAKGDPAFAAAPRLRLDRVDLKFVLAVHDRGFVTGSVSSPFNRSPLDQPEQVVLRPRVNTDDFDEPRRSDDGALNFLVGQVRYGVCQQETDADVDRWWSMTYLGWVPHSDLETGDVQIIGEDDCPEPPS